MADAIRKLKFEDFRRYCLLKKGVTEEFPFGELNPVYKAGGKIFAISTLESAFWVNLKCDPELAADLRERHEEITPGYHMNKKHWNTVDFSGNLPDKDLKKMIDHSYELVMSKLKKNIRDKFLT